MAGNDFAMQLLADILGLRVERPIVTETTALERRFEPAMAAGERQERLAGWRVAVGRVLTAESGGAGA